jgi:hypothetical protein
MSLVPYTITALAESDAAGTGGRNIVIGAVVTLQTPDGGVVTLHDDAAGANPSTAKTTGAKGFVTVFVEPGEYQTFINGNARGRVVVAGKGVREIAEAAVNADNLAATGSDVLVGGVEAGVLATVAETLNPSMYGAIPMGETGGNTDQTTAIQLMFDEIANGYRNFDFQGKTYYLGGINTHYASKFQFVEIDGLNIFGNPKFVVDTEFEAEEILYESIFEFVDCSDLYVECRANGENGFDVNAPQASGVVAVHLVSDTKNAKNVTVISSVEYGVAALRGMAEWRKVGYPTWQPRGVSDPFYRDIKFTCSAKNAKYGVSLISVGDGVQGKVTTDKVTRSYFIADVRNHLVDIVSYRQFTVTDLLIKSYDSGVSDILVNFTQIGSTSTEDAFAIEHENVDQNTRIENVTINYTGEKVASQNAIGLIGALDITNGTYRASTTCVTDNIELNINNRFSGAPSGNVIDFRSVQDLPANVRINRIPVLKGLSSKGFTLQDGRQLYAIGRAGESLRFKLDTLNSASFIADVVLYSTRDFTDNGTASVNYWRYTVRGFFLSGGGGSIQSSTLVDSYAGSNTPTITFSIANQTLTVATTESSANATLSGTFNILSATG